VIDYTHLENIAKELITVFEIAAPPIPIESILQHPKEDMWEELDISQISATFFKITEHYSPRMSMARLLARHVVTCKWGQQRDLKDLRRDEDKLYAFARMLVMPANMILELQDASRTPEAISAHFEVPEEDARLRLLDFKT
jgi:hypothetical protein